MVNSQDIYSVAKSLASRNEKASNRSSISRAYYASFHKGLEFFRMYGVDIPEKSEAHQDLIYCFNNTGIEKISNLGSKFGDMRTLRTKADYKLSDPNSESNGTVLDALDWAKEIIDGLSPLSDEEKTKLRSTLKTWNDTSKKLKLR